MSGSPEYPQRLSNHPALILREQQHRPNPALRAPPGLVIGQELNVRSVTLVALRARHRLRNPKLRVDAVVPLDLEIAVVWTLSYEELLRIGLHVHFKLTQPTVPANTLIGFKD